MLEEFETASEIFNSAEQSIRDAGNSNKESDKVWKNGSYNTSHMLTPESIHAASLLIMSQKLSLSPSALAKKYFICDIGIKEPEVPYIDGETLYINDAVNHTKKTKLPSFINFGDGHHQVLISIVPDDKTNSELSVLYINSETQDENLTKTGKNFACTLAEYINNGDNSFIDKSQQQQYDNCCGLSVVSNIADVAKHFAIRKNVEDNIAFSIPQDKNLLMNHYKDFGSEVFKSIEDKALDLNFVVATDEDKTLIKDLVTILNHDASKVVDNACEVLKTIADNLGENQVKKIIVQAVSYGKEDKGYFASKSLNDLLSELSNPPPQIQRKLSETDQNLLRQFNTGNIYNAHKGEQRSSNNKVTSGLLHNSLSTESAKGALKQR